MKYILILLLLAGCTTFDSPKKPEIKHHSFQLTVFKSSDGLADQYGGSIERNDFGTN